MSSATFYTDRNQAATPRVQEQIPPAVWRGLVGLIQRRIDDGSFGGAFPFYGCHRYPEAVTGTDEKAFGTELITLLPELRKVAGPLPSGGRMTLLISHPGPPTPVALDVIDFAGRYIAEPVERHQHTDMQHQHLEFDQPESESRGQKRFRDDVELIFARNGIAFTIDDDMKVRRLGPPEARPLVSDFAPNSGDAKLDELLGDAQNRFLSRNPQDRSDALEKLWDAFERLKTLEDPSNKKASITALLAKAAGNDAQFQAHLDTECGELTKIGNYFYIRHFEVDKQPLPAPTETSVDYLFTRMLSLIAYLLRKTGRA